NRSIFLDKAILTIIMPQVVGGARSVCGVVEQSHYETSATATVLSEKELRQISIAGPSGEEDGSASTRFTATFAFAEARHRFLPQLPLVLGEAIAFRHPQTKVLRKGRTHFSSLRPTKFPKGPPGFFGLWALLNQPIASGTVLSPINANLGPLPRLIGN